MVLLQKIVVPFIINEAQRNLYNQKQKNNKVINDEMCSLLRSFFLRFFFTILLSFFNYLQWTNIITCFLVVFVVRPIAKWKLRKIEKWKISVRKECQYNKS